MIGYIKGYHICNITTKKLDKKEFLSELIKSDVNLKNKILDVLNDNGYVVGLKKNKVLKVVYLFKENKLQRKMEFYDSFVTKDIEDKIVEKFEKVVMEELKEMIILKGYSKVVWKDMELRTNKSSNSFGLIFFACVFLGILLGLIFDNIALGFLFGVTIGFCFDNFKIKKK